MKEKKNFGFFSQGYEAPRAEKVVVENEGLLLSASELTGEDESEVIEVINGFWDNPIP